MWCLLALLALLGLWSAAAIGDFSLYGAKVTVSYGAEDAAQLYDPKLAKALAALSKLVYCGPLNGTAQAILRSTSAVMQEAGLRLSSPRLVARRDLGAPDADFAAVSRFTALSSASAQPSRGCVISFRGTDNEANNVENSRQRLVNWQSSEDLVCNGCQVCAGCKVFDGYHMIWKQLRPGVLQALQGLGCRSGDALLLTGHNLGAGLMTLAMYDLKAQDAYDVQLSYNFESPRMGNMAFATSFNRLFGRRVALFRVTHANDAVPHYPNDQAYVHVGNQVWYPGGDMEEYTLCANSTAGRECGNDAIFEHNLCPLAQDDCKGDDAEYCKRTCGFPPAHGPHCVHPLAPAYNFCDFAGETTKQMQEEFERSCVWGLAAWMTTPAPTTTTTTETTTTATTATSTSTTTPLPPGAVACAEEDTSWQPLDLPGTMPTPVETAADCQELCHKKAGCEHFSFFVLVKSCHLEDANAYKMEHSYGVTAGPKACGSSHSHVVEKFASAYALSGASGKEVRAVALAGTASALTALAAVLFCIRRPWQAHLQRCGLRGQEANVRRAATLRRVYEELRRDEFTI
mmetsp:Transcript_78789/g.231162  ORF Transcript_78789/g.231162 Transcript_78789/m.231162 type:complete len:572 (+) Transcript_78789:100-1815(+)